MKDSLLAACSIPLFQVAMWCCNREEGVINSEVQSLRKRTTRIERMESFSVMPALWPPSDPPPQGLLRPPGLQQQALCVTAVRPGSVNWAFEVCSLPPSCQPEHQPLFSLPRTADNIEEPQPTAESVRLQCSRCVRNTPQYPGGWRGGVSTSSCLVLNANLNVHVLHTELGLMALKLQLFVHRYISACKQHENSSFTPEFGDLTPV